MANKPRPRTHFRVLALIVFVCVSLYIGSYYLLERQEVRLVGNGVQDSPFKLMPRLFYRDKSDFTYTLFKAAHAIDTVLRPGRWGPQEFPPIDSMTLYSLHDGGPSEHEETFHDYSVLGKTGVASADDRIAIFNAIQKGIADGNPGAMGCFDPHHGVRLSRNGKTIDYVICFHCLAIHEYIDGNYSEQQTGPRAWDLLDAHLKKAGIPQLKSP